VLDHEFARSPGSIARRRDRPDDPAIRRADDSSVFERPRSRNGHIRAVVYEQYSVGTTARRDSRRPRAGCPGQTSCLWLTAFVRVCPSGRLGPLGPAAGARMIRSRSDGGSGRGRRGRRFGHHSLRQPRRASARRSGHGHRAGERGRLGCRDATALCDQTAPSGDSSTMASDQPPPAGPRAVGTDRERRDRHPCRSIVEERARAHGVKVGVSGSAAKTFVAIQDRQRAPSLKPPRAVSLF
jgi:hypothetical protein